MMLMYTGKCSPYECTQKYVTTNLTMFAGVYMSLVMSVEVFEGAFFAHV